MQQGNIGLSLGAIVGAAAFVQMIVLSQVVRAGTEVVTGKNKGHYRGAMQNGKPENGLPLPQYFAINTILIQLHRSFSLLALPRLDWK